MLDQLYFKVNGYFQDLAFVLSYHWAHMTPAKYTILLVSIGVFGWILMRNGVRQY